MEVWIAAVLMIIFSIWWYTDLYKIITNVSDKLLVKNKLLTIITAVVLTGSIFLTYKLTKPVKHVEQDNISTLSEAKKLEKITGGQLLMPQHIGEFAAYGSRDIKATVYNPIPINEAKNYLGSAFGNINFNLMDGILPSS